MTDRPKLLLRQALLPVPGLPANRAAADAGPAVSEPEAVPSLAATAVCRRVKELGPRATEQAFSAVGFRVDSCAGSVAGSVANSVHAGSAPSAARRDGKNAPAPPCAGAPDEAGRALRRFCLACQGNSSRHVSVCGDRECPLFACRLTGLADAGTTPVRAVRAIRVFCLGCAGSPREVRACQAGTSCQLWSFRFGVHPRTFKEVWARFWAPRQLRLFP